MVSFTSKASILGTDFMAEKYILATRAQYSQSAKAQ